MERGIKALRDNLDIVSMRAVTSNEITKLITDIQPHVTIAQTEFSLNDNVLILKYNIQNHGRYNVVVENPVVYLSNTHQYPGNTPDKAIPSESYLVDATKLGPLPPNTSNIRIVDIHLEKIPNSKTIYTTVVYNLKTQAIVLEIAKKYAEGILTIDECIVRGIGEKDY